MQRLYGYAYHVGVVEKYAKGAEKVVDWGGQYGHVTLMLREFFGGAVECYLVDCGETEKYWHQVFGGVKIHVPPPHTPIGKLDYDDATVDVVISSGVLEHTYEYGVLDIEALREIYRILKPGGKLFIWNLPAKNGMPELINKVIGRWYHICRYEQDNLLCLLQAAGFNALVLDKHEILFPVMRSVMMRILGYWPGFSLEYWLSKVPILSMFSQHFTIVCEKVDGFNFSLPYNGAISDHQGFGRSVVRDVS